MIVYIENQKYVKDILMVLIRKLVIWYISQCRKSVLLSACKENNYKLKIALLIASNP